MTQAEPIRVIPGAMAEIIEREKSPSILLIGGTCESVGGLLPSGERRVGLRTKLTQKHTHTHNGVARFRTSWKHLDASIPAVHSVLNPKRQQISFFGFNHFELFSLTRLQMCLTPHPHPGSAHLVLFDILLDSLQTTASLRLHGQWQSLLDPRLKRMQGASQGENAPKDPCIPIKL